MTMPEATPVELATLRWGAQDAQPAVLLLHGLASSAGTWWQVASELADRGCSVTAADLRGHGSSPRTTRYRHADHAADVLQLSPHGNHARPWDLVIGHSLGGAVAVAAASRRPHWTHALLLLDPVLALNPDDHEELLGGLLAELGQRDPEALLRQHPAWHPEDATQKVAAARLVSPTVVERTIRDNRDWQLGPAAAGLRCRVRTLAADPALDASFSAELGDRLTEAAAGFDYAVVTGSGHSIQRDDPARVVAEAVELLARPGDPLV